MFLDLDEFDELTAELCLLLLDADDGSLTTSELRENSTAEDTHAVKYRVSEKLESFGIAEMESQGEDQYGRPLPKVVQMTDDARESLPRYRDELEQMTTTDADMEYRVRRIETGIRRISRDVRDLRERVDDLE